MIHFTETGTFQAINQKVWLVRMITACILIVMVAAQLFTYESFVDVFGYVKGWNTVVAALIVTLEVAALPYLLSMGVSNAMRLVSKTAGWMVAMIWIIVSAVLPAGATSGFFGTIIPVAGGLAAIGTAALFCVLVAVSTSYGRRS